MLYGRPEYDVTDEPRSCQPTAAGIWIVFLAAALRTRIPSVQWTHGPLTFRSTKPRGPSDTREKSSALLGWPTVA